MSALPDSIATAVLVMLCAKLLCSGSHACMTATPPTLPRLSCTHQLTPCCNSLYQAWKAVLRVYHKVARKSCQQAMYLWSRHAAQHNHLSQTAYYLPHWLTGLRGPGGRCDQDQNNTRKELYNTRLKIYLSCYRFTSVFVPINGRQGPPESEEGVRALKSHGHPGHRHCC